MANGCINSLRFHCILHKHHPATLLCHQKCRKIEFSTHFLLQARQSAAMLHGSHFLGSSSVGNPSPPPRSARRTVIRAAPKPPPSKRTWPQRLMRSVDEDTGSDYLFRAAYSSEGDSDDSRHSATDTSGRRLDRDDFKETSRVHFRTAFDFPRWAAHRSTKRYARHMVGMFSSRMASGLAPPLLFVAGASTTAGVLFSLGEAGVIPPPTLVLIDSRLPLQLTSAALALLLVFRTNASYARWLDARKAWGLLINRSRDLTRQGLVWLPGDEDALLRALLCRWVIALPTCVKCHIREGEDAIAEVHAMELLLPEELEALQAAQHRPNYAIQVLSFAVVEVARRRPQYGGILANMDTNLSAMEDIVGTCERILRTPIPLSYTRHTSRFMILWLTMLPLALWQPCRWGMVPVCVMISFLLLGIEECGVAIEEPFSILPLDLFCSTIKANVEEMEAWSEIMTNEGSASENGAGRKMPVPAAELVRRATATQ